MAITKISRLQNRRGLKSDLPTSLYEGEIGWCLDTRELFIGNSDGFGGNSQILTEWTPNDALIQHTYRGSNGIRSSAMPRSIGSKLDDFVSVRDYGAIGNGLADDTAAIQAAIEDRYAVIAASGYSPLGGYATIWIPAGTYVISQPIKLYPYVKLQGEGSNRTLITMNNTVANCMFQTVDGNGNTATNIGMNSATLPQYIDLVDLWLNQPNNNKDVILLQRAKNVTVTGVKITGPWVNSSNIQIDTNGISIESLGSTYIPDNISIQDCEISGMGYAVFSNDPITNLRINLSNMHNCWNGVVLGQSSYLGGPSMIKITNCVFTDIDSYGIACYSTNPGVISTGNSFNGVGVYYSNPPILWSAGTSSCASIGDQFINSQQLVQDNNPALNITINPQKYSVISNLPDIAGPILLLDNNPSSAVDTEIFFYIREYNTINIIYSISRNNNKRTGTITMLTDGVNTVLQDEYTTLKDDVGITFGYRLDSANGKLIITYLSTTTGYDASFFIVSSSSWLT